MAFFIFVAAAAAAAQPAAPQSSGSLRWYPPPKTQVSPAAKSSSDQTQPVTAAPGQAAPVPAEDGGRSRYWQGQQAIAGADNATPQVAPAPATAQPGSAQRPLALTCLGAGTASKATTAVGWGWGGWGMVSGHKDRSFNDQVDIRLFMGDDRIRLPRTMLPGFHGGQGGWFRFTDVVADARSIDGHASVWAFHNPKVHIDRVTGTISISGKDGDYAGQCQVIDANAAPKF